MGSAWYFTNASQEYFKLQQERHETISDGLLKRVDELAHDTFIYLSHQAQISLSICTVSPEPSLLAFRCLQAASRVIDKDSCKMFCKFQKFHDNIIFTNSIKIKRHIYHDNNSRLRHDLHTSVNDRGISPYAKFLENKPLTKISEFIVIRSLPRKLQLYSMYI